MSETSCKRPPLVSWSLTGSSAVPICSHRLFKKNIHLMLQNFSPRWIRCKGSCSCLQYCKISLHPFVTATGVRRSACLQTEKFTKTRIQVCNCEMCCPGEKKWFEPMTSAILVQRSTNWAGSRSRSSEFNKFITVIYMYSFELWTQSGLYSICFLMCICSFVTLVKIRKQRGRKKHPRNGKELCWLVSELSGVGFWLVCSC